MQTRLIMNPKTYQRRNNALFQVGSKVVRKPNTQNAATARNGTEANHLIRFAFKLRLKSFQRSMDRICGIWSATNQTGDQSAVMDGCKD